MSADTLRVAAFGFFGMGNIGNEGTLAAFLGYAREAHPEASLSCFAADAIATEREHGISAAQLMSYRADPSRSGPLPNLVKAVSRVWDCPRTLQMVRRVDVLVVTGTGILESKLMPTPWGLPYWLFLTALACRLQGRRVVLLGVGAEYPSHPVTRWLYRRILQLSQFRSFRDEESRNAMISVGGASLLDAVVPDLTFAMPTPDHGPVRAGHVAIGVMAYDGAVDDPNRGDGVRRRYLDGMTELVTRLVDEGRTVTLFIGDGHDQPVAVDIERLVRESRRELHSNVLTVSGARTLQAIMAEMAAAEVVVASRFHNVICALKLAKPVVSLGYADKNKDLLRQFGLEEFDHPIDTFDVDRLLDDIDDVRRKAPLRESRVISTLQDFSAALEEHYRELANSVLIPRPAKVERWRRRPPKDLPVA